jgi:hypothetical protein
MSSRPRAHPLVRPGYPAQRYQRPAPQLGQERIVARIPPAGGHGDGVDVAAQPRARPPGSIVQVITIGPADHQQVNVGRGGTCLAGDPRRPGAEDGGRAYAVQPCQFLAKDLCRTQDNHDEIPQRLVKRSLMVGLH